MPAEAFAVHGLSVEFLKDKPCFHEIADEFLQFIGDAPLVIHNAAFDLAFINAELERAARPVLGRDRLLDTLMIARRKHPGGSNRLDDLCARYSIDNSRRTKHGALLDAEILAEVYLELIDARQAKLGLGEQGDGYDRDARHISISVRVRPVPLAPRITDEERAAHLAFIATLGDEPIWQQYLPRAALGAAAAAAA